MILQIEARYFNRMLSVRSVIEKFKKIDKQHAQLAVESWGETVWETRVENGVGYIPVQGVLLPKRSWIMDFFEDTHTSYSDISKALSEMANDSSVDTVVLEINSPGGYTDGLDSLVTQLQGYGKPVSSRVNGMCCSAAYHIAVATEFIVCQNKGDLVGSIGTMVEGYDLSKWEEIVGIKSIVVTNRSSTDKLIDFSSEKSVDILRDELDDIQEIFESDIIAGRSVNKLFSIEAVHDLKGRIITAKKAVDIGLIDSIGVLDPVVVEKNEGNNKQGAMKRLSTEGDRMNLKQFLAENPEAQQEYSAELSAQYDAGVEGERARVGELLDLAGVQMSATLKNAVETGQDTGAYAKAQLKAHSTPTQHKSPAAATPNMQRDAEETQKSDADVYRENAKRARGKK